MLHETFAYEDSTKTFAKSFDSFAILSSRNDPLVKARLLMSPCRVHLPRTVCGTVCVVNMEQLVFNKSFPFEIMLVKIEPSFISVVFGSLIRSHRRNLRSASPD